MFFSLIRAPNQLSPKTKVVDLLFLYNFYFGQIPSFYMKFGVSAGQTGVKIIQRVNSGLLCSVLCTPVPIPASERRRATPRVATAGDPRRPRAVLIHAVALEASRSVRCFPFLELARAELAAVRPADHPSPLRLDSPRLEPSSLAVHLLRSIP